MIDWSWQYNRTMMVLLWLVHLSCSGQNCPTDLFSDVFGCLQNLTQGRNFSTIMSDKDVEQMNRNCRNGAFDDSVQCLERLHGRYDDDPTAFEWLQKLARPRRWEAGFQRFCKHINLYIEKDQCVRQQSTDVGACINRHTRIFTIYNDYLSNKPNKNSVDYDGMKSICSVFHWIDHCLNKPLGLACGEPVGAIVTDFHGGITPPICIDYQELNNSARQLCISNHLLVTMFAWVFFGVNQVGILYV